jgi:uncharacterized protein (DUF433 family)
MDGATGCPAVLAGTGIDVWEVVHIYKRSSRRFAGPREAFRHVAELQVRAAINYAILCTEEIRRCITASDVWTPID